jgi:hypothetical protein
MHERSGSQCRLWHQSQGWSCPCTQRQQHYTLGLSTTLRLALARQHASTYSTATIRKGINRESSGALSAHNNMHNSCTAVYVPSSCSCPDRTGCSSDEATSNALQIRDAVLGPCHGGPQILGFKLEVIDSVPDERHLAAVRRSRQRLLLVAESYNCVLTSQFTVQSQYVEITWQAFAVRATNIRLLTMRHTPAP